MLSERSRVMPTYGTATCWREHLSGEHSPQGAPVRGSHMSEGAPIGGSHPSEGASVRGSTCYREHPQEGAPVTRSTRHREHLSQGAPIRGSTCRWEPPVRPILDGRKEGPGDVGWAWCRQSQEPSSSGLGPGPPTPQSASVPARPVLEEWGEAKRAAAGACGEPRVTCSRPLLPASPPGFPTATSSPVCTASPIAALDLLEPS